MGGNSLSEAKHICLSASINVSEINQKNVLQANILLKHQSFGFE